ncbi:hypothetical protein Leryth_023902 [Lithospermum erythrorhizon]|nr:hypothetical protein Leryth_023902 [Lithospermum erythrorhizon]
MSSNIFPPPSLLSLTSMTQVHQTHAQMLKTGFFHHPYLSSRLLTAATTISPSLSYPHSIFNNIHQPNSYIYNTIIRAYSTSPTPLQSFHIFIDMLFDAYVVPDKFTFTFILKACAALCSIEYGQQIHGVLVKGGFYDDVYVYNTLVHVYAKGGSFCNARVLLDKMSEPDVIAWNAVLSAYVEMGLMDLAREFLNEMPVKNQESWNFMVSGYVNVGLVDEARSIFDEMLEKDVVSWNSLITGYAKVGDYCEVLRLFEDMQRGGNVVPDNCTLVNVLSACAGVGALGQGDWVQAYIDKNGIEVNGFLATALVDMYSKCGCIEKALEVFNRTSKKDVSTWNSMISGLSVHGYGESALETFNRMVADGYKPNDVTFVSVLAACSREWFLEEGREMFRNMEEKYGIEPSVEHYGCMVDLLGRYGLLKEAAELVKGISVKECPGIWASLLNACRNHGDLELAKMVAEKLFEVDPLDSANYVQLSNAYASTGRWNEAMGVRGIMRSKGVNKEPGCSMIEVDGTVHEFLAGEGLIKELSIDDCS